MSEKVTDVVSFNNGIEIELCQAGDEFLGLGAIRAGDDILRSGQRPMFVHLRTPNGVEFSRYQLAGKKIEADRAILDFSAHYTAGGLMEWMVHEVRPRYNTANWTQTPQLAPDMTLRLELQAVTRTLNGREYQGFSYRYSYNSQQFPMYKILDRGTWELGGNAVNNEFWMRNCFVPPIVRIESSEQFYSSEWYIPDCVNPSAFQFVPLQTELQGFTFTAAREGVLATWVTDVAHVRSLFEKPRGEDVFVHFHEHCGDLGSSLQSAAVEVLYAPGVRDRVELFNDYEAVKELVHDTLHGHIGMRRERVTSYGQIEEWGPANMDYYRREGVPKLLEAGCKTIYMANHFQNNMNSWDVGNFCNTIDYKVSENVGEENLRALCQAIRDGGAVPEMWGNTSISTLSWLFSWERTREGTGQSSKRIDFLPYEGSIMEALEGIETKFVRNPSNAVEADHYTPMFMVLNLREPAVREYWLKRWKEAHDNVGLGGIFLDSSFNLSSDKWTWIQNAQPDSIGGATADNLHLLGNMRPEQEPPSAILSQYRAHLDLMTEMQKIGYVYCNEDLGVFGIHRHGPGIRTRLSNLPMWADCVASFDISDLKSIGADIDDVFFRGLAYRLMWSLYWDIDKNTLAWSYGSLRDDSYRPTDWQIKLLHVYNEATDHMRERTILPDETGVLYHDGESTVLWAFRDDALEFPAGATVRDLVSGEENVTRAQRHRVYLITQ